MHCFLGSPSKKFLPFLGQDSYRLDQDCKILDQQGKNPLKNLDIIARMQDAVRLPRGRRDCQLFLLICDRTVRNHLLVCLCCRLGSHSHTRSKWCVYFQTAAATPQGEDLIRGRPLIERDILFQTTMVDGDWLWMTILYSNGKKCMCVHASGCELVCC